MFKELLAVKKQLLWVVVGFGLVSSSWGAVSFSSAETVFKRLLSKNHITGYTHLVYSKDVDINAYSTGGKVVIYAGMLRYLQNNQELAMVLGHELAHEVGESNEANSDVLGAMFARQAGYSVCAGAQWLTRVPVVYTPANGTYPSSVNRYKNLGC